MSNRLAFTVHVSGDKPVLMALSRFGEAADDLRPAFHEIDEDFREHVRETFAREGPGWRPLSPRYAAYKRHRWGSVGILVAEGKLLDSLSGGAGYIRRISRRDAELGTRDPKALFHQHGTVYMVARPPLKITRAVRERWARIIHQHVVDALHSGRGSGLLNRLRR